MSSNKQQQNNNNSNPGGRKLSLAATDAATTSSIASTSSSSSFASSSNNVHQQTTSKLVPPRTYRVAVVGYCSSNLLQQQSSSSSATVAGGAGKSCMCQRMVHPAEDDYTPHEHTSVLNLTDFSGSPVINNEHFIYWGCAKRPPLNDAAGAECCFEIIEHTEFVDDADFQPHRTMAAGKFEPYIKRSTRLSLTSSNGKLQYFGRNQLGLEQEYPQTPMMHASPPDSTAFTIDGFIVCYDVSAARANILSSAFSSSSPSSLGASSSSGEAFPPSCTEQSDLVLKLLQNIYKQPHQQQRRPCIVLATTKNDEQYKPLSRDAEKIINRKEFKGTVQLVETSAHRNVNISAAFMLLAQLIDRTSTAANIIKPVAYTEACRVQGTKLALTSTQFDNLLRTIPISLSSYGAVKGMLDTSEIFRQFLQLFGEQCARRKIEQHLHALNERQLHARQQQQLHELRTIMLPKLLPDIRAYMENARKISWQHFLKSLPNFTVFFYPDASEHAVVRSVRSSPAVITKSPSSNNNAAFSSPVLGTRSPPVLSSPPIEKLPESILYHADADKCFSAYLEVAQERLRYMLACDSFLELLRVCPQDVLLPGRPLHDVMPYLPPQQHNNGAVDITILGDDKKLELYAMYQRQLIDHAKYEFKEFMWENIDAFLHVLLYMPQQQQQQHYNGRKKLNYHKPTNVESHAATNLSLLAETNLIDSLLANIRDENEDGSRYRALNYIAQEREKLLQQHVWLLRSSMPEVCPGPRRYCADLYISSVLDIAVVATNDAVASIENCPVDDDVDDSHHHRVIIRGGACAERLLNRLKMLLPYEKQQNLLQIEMDDGILHTIDAVIAADESKSCCYAESDDNENCHIFVYNDFASLARLYTVLNNSKREEELVNGLPSSTTSAPAGTSHRLSLVILDSAFNYQQERSAHNNGGADIFSEQDFFQLFQQGVTLAEQLGGIFLQLTNNKAACSKHVVDDDVANQQLISSLQCLLYEHSMSQRRQRRRSCRRQCHDDESGRRKSNSTSGGGNTRRRHSGDDISRGLLLSARTPSLSLVELGSAEKCDVADFDLHIRICFCCDDMLTTRHVLMCILRYYFCSRSSSSPSSSSSSSLLTTEFDGVCGVDIGVQYKQHQQDNYALDSAAAHHRQQKASTARTIVFNVYTSAPQSSSSRANDSVNNYDDDDNDGRVGLPTQHNINAISLSSLASTTNVNEKKVRYRVHVHFTSYHDILRQLCCSTSSREFYQKSSKSTRRKNYTTVPSVLMTSDCCCQSAPSSLDGVVLVYNAARASSFAMAHALGNEMLLLHTQQKTLAAPPVMMLAISSGSSENITGGGWSERETALIRDGISLCEDLQGRWLTCSLVEPIPKIAFDHFWKSCWQARQYKQHAMALSYEVASTATIHTNNSSSVNSLAVGAAAGGAGFYYAVPAAARPSVASSSDQQHQQSGDAVENVMYGAVHTASTNVADENNDVENVFAERTDEEEEDNDDDDDAAVSTIVAVDAAVVRSNNNNINEIRRKSIVQENIGVYNCQQAEQQAAKAAIRNNNNNDATPAEFTISSVASVEARRRLLLAASVTGSSNSNSAVVNTELPNVEGSNDGGGGGRRSRTEALRMKFENDRLAAAAVAAAAAANDQYKASNKCEPSSSRKHLSTQKNATSSDGNNNNARFSATTPSSTNLATFAANAPGLVQHNNNNNNSRRPANDSSADAGDDTGGETSGDDDNNDDDNDDDEEDDGSPPPLPGRLRNSSKYNAIMGHLNDNIQQQKVVRNKLFQHFQQQHKDGDDDLAPSQPGCSSGSADVKKKKKRKPPSMTTDATAAADQADGIRNLLFFNNARRNSKSTTNDNENGGGSGGVKFLYAGQELKSPSAVAAAAANLTSAAMGKNYRQPKSSFLAADAAWHDEHEQQKLKSGGVHLLSVKGLGRSSDAPGGAGSKKSTASQPPYHPHNARFVLPPMSPRQIMRAQKDNDNVLPLSPGASVAGATSSVENERPSFLSKSLLFSASANSSNSNNDNSGKLRKSFDAKKRNSASGSKKGASTPSTGGASGGDASSIATCLPAETFEELVVQSSLTSSSSENTRTSLIPKFIELCIEFLENDAVNAMEMEGLYRVSGNRAQATLLMADFYAATSTTIATKVSVKPKKSSAAVVDENKATAKNFTIPVDTPITTVCTALKMYLNERTPPLFPKRLVDVLVNTIKFSNLPSLDEKVSVLQGCQPFLSPANYAVLKYITAHLHRVSRLAHINMMTARNLSICWWPTCCARREFPNMDEFERVHVVLEDVVTVMIDEQSAVFSK